MHHRAKFIQNRSKRLQRYGDLTVFEMSAWIFEIHFLTVWAVNKPILHHCTKFRRPKDRSNRCGDIAIFVIFTIAAAPNLDFQKFEILTVGALKGANVRQRAKFHENRLNGCRDMAI